MSKLRRGGAARVWQVDTPAARDPTCDAHAALRPSPHGAPPRLARPLQERSQGGPMRHLTNERLAEMAWAGAEEGEKAHLARCARCTAAARFFAELRGAVATNEGVTGDARARAHAAAIVSLASAEATAL